MKAVVVERMFKAATDRIVDHVSTILKATEAVKKVSMVLMVGGFSESPYVQKEMKARIREAVGVLVPKDAGLAVLYGAVVYGREPESIASRVLRCHYGVKVCRTFKEGFDEEIKRPPTSRNLVGDAFKLLMKEGTSVECSKKVLDVFRTASRFQKEMAIHVCVANGDVPKYVTDGNCRLLGTLFVQIPTPSEKTRDLSMIFKFGSTALVLFAEEGKSGQRCEATFSQD